MGLRDALRRLLRPDEVTAGSERRARSDRRSGADRRAQELGPPDDTEERRSGVDRRSGRDRRDVS